MALHRDGLSFSTRLRSRPNFYFRGSTSFLPDLPMDIWNRIDELTGIPFSESFRFRSRGQVSFDVLDRCLADWFRLSTNGIRDQEKLPQRVDTEAVLGKCRKVVYKPSSSIWGKAKAEAGQSECPVCLEKFVSKDKLLMLPCNHQFHVDCLTPWIKRNHACCPCCRADILRGRRNDERGNASNDNRNSLMNFRQWLNSGGSDLGNEATFGRNNNARSNRNRHANVVEEDSDAWEGLHEYIMAALAEVDAELNRFMR